jgi:cytochrome c peroxidase
MTMRVLTFSFVLLLGAVAEQARAQPQAEPRDQPQVEEGARPRFVLPDVPFDYAPRAASGLERHFPLPARNGGPALRGSTGAAPADGVPAARDRANELATLGRVLFHDRLLSRNGARSCSSCHEQARAFADGKARSRGFAGRLTKRNSISIANLGFAGGGFFWDARASSLEQLVLMPVVDPVEMGLDLDTLVARLRAEPGYAALFAGAFGDERVDPQRIAAALAQFVRSIVSLRSRYDEGLAATGDVDAEFPDFTAAENRGKRMFFGDRGTRASSCAACHVERAWSWCGNSWFLEPLSVCSERCTSNGLDRGAAGDDAGLGAVTGEAEDTGKFRAPSLRNVELTGPYMHDGRFATLEEVVQFYSDRVRAHPNLDAALRRDGRDGDGWGGRHGRPAPMADAAVTSKPAALGFPMTSRERADLVAFLKTLTDRELVRDERFADPFVARRAK